MSAANGHIQLEFQLTRQAAALSDEEMSDDAPDQIPAKGKIPTKEEEAAAAEEDEDDDDEEGEEYRVEKVLKHRFNGADVEYLIKWFGYDKKADQTWEPLENLSVSFRLYTCVPTHSATDTSQGERAGSTQRIPHQHRRPPRTALEKGQTRQALRLLRLRLTRRRGQRQKGARRPQIRGQRYTLQSRASGRFLGNRHPTRHEHH